MRGGWDEKGNRWLGPFLALSAALAFAVSVPVGKFLLDETSQYAVAGLFYLGAGLTISAYRLLARVSTSRRDAPGARALAANPRMADWGWLAGATLSGAVGAPLLLLWGLHLTSAATASLLLSFETVFTALWAAGLFKEHVAPQVWWAVLALTGGGVLLGLDSEADWGFSVGALAVVGGCALWGLDNNLTRNITGLEPSAVAQLKGLAAGAVNLLLLLSLGASLPEWPLMLLALAAGGVSYGLSLVLFVKALRYLGSARTSGYFGAGPFFAAMISLFAAATFPTLRLLGAGLLMLAGALLMILEQHQHEHEHEGVSHTHWHVPDAEHRHGH